MNNTKLISKAKSLIALYTYYLKLPGCNKTMLKEIKRLKRVIKELENE